MSPLRQYSVRWPEPRPWNLLARRYPALLFRERALIRPRSLPSNLRNHYRGTRSPRPRTEHRECVLEVPQALSWQAIHSLCALPKTARKDSRNIDIPLHSRSREVPTSSRTVTSRSRPPSNTIEHHLCESLIPWAARLFPEKKEGCQPIPRPSPLTKEEKGRQIKITNTVTIGHSKPSQVFPVFFDCSSISCGAWNYIGASLVFELQLT
jgi:hypothetical protein